MKKGVKIFLAILVVLILAVGIFAFLQRDNIRAYVLSQNSSQEDIQQMLNDNESNRDAAVKKYNIRELTDSEKQSIANGTLSTSDAIDLVTGSSSSNDPNSSGTSDSSSDSQSTATPKPSNSPEKTTSQYEISQSDADAQISTLIGRIYALEASFSGRLDSMLSSAIGEYKALPESERTDSNKISIVSKYIGQAGAMESACDSEMASILSEMEKILTKSGQSLDLIQQINSSYQSEKSLKKAYYISLYT